MLRHMPHPTIAIFLPSLTGGGAERVMLNLATGMADLGFNIDLVLAKAEGQYLSQVSKHINVIDLDSPRTLQSLPKLIRYLKRAKPKALISAIEHTNILAIWAKKLSGVATKVIISEHNPPSMLKHATQATVKKLGAIKLAMRLSYPMADQIIAVSQGVADDLETLVAKDKVQVIHNPVLRKEMFQKAKEPLDHPWFTSGEPPVILAIGRLEKQKDFPNLIGAFAQLRQQQPVRLLILGEGQERPALESLIAELGLQKDVSLHGFDSNPYRYIQHCSVFVMSSVMEGLPTVLIEAMALGSRLVSTDCESGPREILADGKYGILVPIQDSTALAKAIKESLKASPSKASQEVLKPYTYETAVHSYLQVAGCVLPIQRNEVI
jgi:glycosyltransferase involved in cell wall biosynthesis